MIRILLVYLCMIFNFCFAQAQKPSAEKIAQLFDFVEEKGPGLSVAVVQNNEILYGKGIGFANLEYDIPNMLRSKFDVASVAKQFTAACIWVLTTQGKISLEDDIRKYLPEFPDYGRQIKIKHLLNHTSGIRGYTYLMDLSGFDGQNNYFDNQTIFELACQQEHLNNIPGEKVIYGNTNFNLLTLIIENITGEKFSVFARKNIFHPLAMNDTFFRDNEKELVINRAVGYEKTSDNTYHRFPRTQQSHGAGSLWSTVSDLVKWTSLFTNEVAAYKDLVTFLTSSEVLPEGERASYARGIMLSDYKGHQTIHHSGFTSGYQSQVISVPSLKLSVIILTNLEAINPSPISYQVIDLFLNNTSSSQPITAQFAKPLSPKKALQFQGDYQELHSDLRMRITFKNDSLQAKTNWATSAIALKQTGTNTFCRAQNQSVTYKFKHKTYDLVVYFGGTPFYFNKASFIAPDQVIFSAYEGNYYSKELKVKYRLFCEGEKLYLSYPNHLKVPLQPGKKDEFGTGNRVLLRFNRTEMNQINSFTVFSAGVVKDILFQKI